VVSFPRSEGSLKWLQISKMAKTRTSPSELLEVESKTNHAGLERPRLGNVCRKHGQRFGREQLLLPRKSAGKSGAMPYQ